MDIKRTPIHGDDIDHVYVDVHLLLVLLVSQGKEEVSIIQHRFRQQKKIQSEFHSIRDKRRLEVSCQQSSNTSNLALELNNFNILILFINNKLC